VDQGLAGGGVIGWWLLVVVWVFVLQISSDLPCPQIVRESAWQVPNKVLCARRVGRVKFRTSAQRWELLSRTGEKKNGEKETRQQWSAFKRNVPTHHDGPGLSGCTWRIIFIVISQTTPISNHDSTR
jgi:hypothetical protein